MSVVLNSGRYLIETPNGFENFTGLQKIQKERIVKLSFDNNKDLTGSENHPMISLGEIKKLKDFVVGDTIDGKFNDAKITSVEFITEETDLYDILDCGKDNLFYVNDLISHNCAFTASDNTLISGEVLRDVDYISPIENSYINEIFESNNWDSYVSMYERPIPHHEYSIGVDMAKMTFKNARDSISMQILDVTKLPFKQVASINIKGGLFYLESPKILSELIKFYNDAICFIENNETGQEIANMLAYEYELKENVFFERFDLAGFRTTVKTKRVGLNFLKVLIENGKLLINDKDTVSQLGSFVKKGRSYAAEAGYYDDSVMALTASIFFLQLSDEKIENMFENAIIPDKLDLLSAIKEKTVLNKVEESEYIEEQTDHFIVSYEDFDEDDFDSNFDDDYSGFGRVDNNFAGL